MTTDRRLHIRRAVPADLPELLRVYEAARRFMRENGNPTQWISYPGPELLLDDIGRGTGYVVESGSGVAGAFVFFTGEEPSYAEIDGKWLDDMPYGVIHRVASDGREHGVLEAVLAFCSARIPNIRIDTHENNAPMRHLLEKYGFKRCGTVYVTDDTGPHSPRIAYQRNTLRKSLTNDISV